MPTFVDATKVLTDNLLFSNGISSPVFENDAQCGSLDDRDPAQRKNRRRFHRIPL
jgi:hypothetical protein